MIPVQCKEKRESELNDWRPPRVHSLLWSRSNLGSPTDYLYFLWPSAQRKRMADLQSCCWLRFFFLAIVVSRLLSRRISSFSLRWVWGSLGCYLGIKVDWLGGKLVYETTIGGFNRIISLQLQMSYFVNTFRRAERRFSDGMQVGFKQRALNSKSASLCCLNLLLFLENRKRPRHAAPIIGSMWQPQRILGGHERGMSHPWQDLQTRVPVCVFIQMQLFITSTSRYMECPLPANKKKKCRAHKLTQYVICNCIVSQMWVSLVLKHTQLKANCRLSEVAADAVFTNGPITPLQRRSLLLRTLNSSLA